MQSAIICALIGCLSTGCPSFANETATYRDSIGTKPVPIIDIRQPHDLSQRARPTERHEKVITSRFANLLHFLSIFLHVTSYLDRSQRPHCTKIAQLRAQLANTRLQQTNLDIFSSCGFIRLPGPSHGVLELADKEVDLQ